MLLNTKHLLNHSKRYLNTSTKVTILGGSGFIGNYVIKSLIQDPFVKIQPISKSGKENPKIKQLGNQVLSTQQGDITNYDQMEHLCKDANVVINLVGVMNQNETNSTNIHINGAENLAKITQSNGSKLIHISAIGANPESSIVYSRTKGLGEVAVKKHNPNTIIVRPSLVIGPEDDFINRFAKIGKYLPFLPVFGGGLTKFQPIYVWDLAKAIQILSNNDSFNGKLFEVGGPNGSFIIYIIL
ncbi:NAD(P)-binding protein [Neoconidiobolus thromboides FSU 785]|nr:NAD(P)-binding protein [Neoconidiobolus thromboides FSU 785]